MEEHTTREEPLSEELLDGITGAGGGASRLGNPGPGSFSSCPSCQANEQKYSQHIYIRDGLQRNVDSHVRVGDYAEADLSLKHSEKHHTRAQEVFQQMAAHGHPDFPAALNQQRRNYNPDLEL